jgi:hypothetical protein
VLFTKCNREQSPAVYLIVAKRARTSSGISREAINMSDLGVQPSADVVPGLSEWQRVTNTFTAPSKTFEDIKRGHRSWWMPFLILSIVGYIFFAVVNTRIGMRTTAENQIRLDPKAEERMAQLTPEQRETQMKFSVYFTEGIFIGGPVVLLVIVAVGSLVLWGTVNFLFGGKATFGGVFATWMFASLPSIVKTLLGIIVIYAGTAPESFNIRNFAPTNLGAFLNPAETNKVLYSLATSLDIMTLWCCVLMAIGISIVAGIKRKSGYIAVFGWWAIIIIGGMIFAAATS